MKSYALLIAALAIVLAIKYWLRIWVALRFPGSSSWSTISAVVEQGIVHTYSGRSETYRAEIIYSYKLRGEYYSGRYQRDLCYSEAEAEDLIEQYPKGAALQVHVHPTRPELSVLKL